MRNPPTVLVQLLPADDTVGMSLVPRETEKRCTHYRCRLGREDLDRLFAVALEGTAGEVTVSTQRASTTYRAATLDALVTLVDTANATGVWADLTLDLTDPEHRRSVTVTLGLKEAEIRLSGSDTTWVYGQDARLREMLESYDGNTDPNLGPQGAIAYLATSFAFLVVTVSSLLNADSASKLLPPGISALLATTSGILFAWARFKSRETAHKWSVTEEVASGSPWSRLSWEVKAWAITACIALPGSLGAVVTFLSI
jgi:hypothetical protein